MYNAYGVYANRMVVPHALYNAFGVRVEDGRPVSQGALARPWAVECNRFAVGRGSPIGIPDDEEAAYNRQDAPNGSPLVSHHNVSHRFQPLQLGVAAVVAGFLDQVVGGGDVVAGLVGVVGGEF